MKKRELTCIGCPMGCALVIEIEDNGELKVSGNSCKVGENYAVKECTNPTRIITTTVQVENGKYASVSVKTEKDIPKEKIFDCIKDLKKVKVEAPVNIGDVIYENIEETGVNIVATKNIMHK